MRFEGVSKRFGDTLAVDDVSLSIYERPDDPESVMHHRPLFERLLKEVGA